MGIYRVLAASGAFVTCGLIAGGYAVYQNNKDKIESINFEDLTDMGIQNLGQLATQFAGSQKTLENCQNVTAVFSEATADQTVTLEDFPQYGTITIPVGDLVAYCPLLFEQ